MELDTPQKIAYIRQKCLSDFLFYVRFFFKLRTGNKFHVYPHHIKIAKALVKIFLGKTNGLIINMPPQSGKTEMIVVMFISWCMAHNPKSKFVHLSSSGNLVLENSYKVREIVQLKEFEILFQIKTKSDSKAKYFWKTDKGGQLYAVTTGGQVAGYPAGILGYGEGFNGALIIDDPLKPDDKHSKVKKNTANRRCMELIASRPASEKTPVILVMQRLGENDPTDHLLKECKIRNWELLKIAALDKDEQSFFTLKYSADTLKKIRASQKWVFAAEFQQEPAPEGGGYYKEKYWRYYRVLPKMEYLCMFADTAQKTKEENDYTVVELWGFAEGRIYLIDQIRAKLEAPELETKVVAFYNKHKDSQLEALRGIRIRHLYIEDKVSGTGLIQRLKRKGGIPVKDIQRSKDKITRAQDSVGQIEAGNVLLPEGASFLNDYLEELSLFPNGEYDDQVDTTNDAIDKMLGSLHKEVRVWVFN